ncbi:hypothetical protein KM043_016597 [Ampulex compressa]|nr:hypothetical protein KM043_016597 [Ampulex compressa]
MAREDGRHTPVMALGGVTRLAMLSDVSALMKVATSAGPHLLKPRLLRAWGPAGAGAAGCRPGPRRLRSVILAGHTSDVCGHLART